MLRTRLVATTGALTLFLLAPGTTALAADPISEAADALKSTSVVTLDKQLNGDDAQKLRAQIKSYGDPIFIAVIPDVPDYDSAARDVGMKVGKPGVYGVISGHHFRAGSSGQYLNSGQAGSLATAALNAHNPSSEKSVTPMLRDFVDRVHNAIQANRAGSGSRTTTTTTTTRHGAVKEKKKESNAGKIFLWILGVLAAIGALILAGLGLKKRSERKAEEARERKEFEVAKRSAEARLASIGSDILKYEPLVGGNANANSIMSDVTDAFARANNVLTNAQTAGELESLGATLSTAEANLQDVKAYVAGRDPVAERAEEAKKEAKRQAERDRRAAKKREQEEAEAAERAEWEERVRTTRYEPAQQQSTTNNNYFGGGYYQGQYYAPGYYQDPFWNFLMMDMMLDHSQHSYDSGDHGHYDEQPTEETTTTTTTTTYDDGGGTDGGDWGSGGGYDSGESSYSGGGGDWGGSSDSGSSYDSGGGDSGGGGGDW